MNEVPGHSYPMAVTVGEQPLLLRLMSEQDRAAMLSFARSLSEHDLMFLRRDITQEAAVDAWLSDIATGVAQTIIAGMPDDAAIVGYATVYNSNLRWSAHVAELRVMVAEPMRGKGLGRLLTQEAFIGALGRGVEKMVAQMTLDQKGAITTFEGLGFRPEALLRDQVKDRSGKKHDLLVLSHEVARFEAALHAYGVAEALRD